MDGARSYRMGTRAAAMGLTRARIVDAAYDAFMTQWYDDVTVRDIAARAGVALQTVLNHFPTKESLCAAANERQASSIEAARWVVEPGDIPGAVSALIGDYERTGDATLRMLAVEERVPAVQEWIALGRQGHEKWVTDVFPEALADLRGSRRKRRVAQLVAVTDVYTWKLLRRDKGLTVAEATIAIRELVEALHQTRGTRGKD